MTYVGKVVLTGAEARKEVLAGAKFLGECVSPTIGPFGTNGILEKGLRITNDGVSIAKEITLDNEVQDLGLRKTRQAAERANDQVGDGSTTCITLAVDIATEVGSKLGDGKVVGSKSTAQLLKQLHQEKDEVIQKLQDAATPITTEEELVRSAVVSVEDEELGELIGKTQFALGPEGYIIPEETIDTKTTVERVLGIRVDNGLGMTQAINNPEKGSLDLNDVPVILTSNTVTRLEPLMHIFEGLAERGQREVVLITRAVSEDCIREIQANAQQKFFIYPVNAPYVNQREVMKDLEAVLGGRFVDQEDGGLDTIQYSDLGHIKLASVRRYDGIFSGESTPEAIERVNKRVEHLKT
jgi:chaperonin GroEL